MTDDSSLRAAPAVPPPRLRQAAWHRWFDARFRTPVAVYGLIVYTTLINIAAEHTSVPEFLVTSILSLFVFYVAHVFAHTLADHGEHPLGVATRRAFVHSAGMLYSAVPTTATLLIGAISVDDSEELADMGTNTMFVMLFLLGFSAYTRTGAPIWLRLLGAFGTVLLGFLVVLLEYIAH